MLRPYISPPHARAELPPEADPPGRAAVWPPEAGKLGPYIT